MTQKPGVPEPPVEDDPRLSTKTLLGIGLATRLVTDTAAQLFYTFLPILSAGIGISAVQMGRLLSLRSLVGLTSPLFGILAERRGYRRVMQFALAIGAAGLLLIASSNGVLQTAAGMLLMGIGLFAFGPNFQAYLSAQLPYHRRARGLGILEYSWALAGIIGLFLVGQLIEIAGWRLPLFLLAGLLMVAAVGFGGLPRTHKVHTPRSRISLRALSWHRFNLGDLGSDWTSTQVCLYVAALLMFAALHLMTTYGKWLFTEYGLGPGELGQVGLLLGVADLGASGIISVFGDRLGARRSVLWAAFGAVLFHLALPFLNQGLLLSLVGLVIARFCFEFAVVSHLVLVSEQAPLRRAKVMTLGAAFALAGSTVANLTGPQAYESFGVMGLALPSAVAYGLAVLLVWRFVHEANGLEIQS